MPEFSALLAVAVSPMFPQATFEKHWQQVAPFVRLHFVGRDETTLNALLVDARQYLQQVCSTEAELMQISSDTPVRSMATVSTPFATNHSTR